jgi:hypothetical protein
MDPTFQDTRECQLVAKLLQAVEDADADAFTSHVAEFDRFVETLPIFTTTNP